MEYKLQDYSELAKRRAILMLIRGRPDGYPGAGGSPDRWVPVAWVDYDDVGRDEADARADAMLAGLLAETNGSRAVTVAGRSCPECGWDASFQPPEIIDCQECGAHLAGPEGRWEARRPGIVPGDADEVVRVEVKVTYPNGLDAEPRFEVWRWWPEHGAVLNADGEGFDHATGTCRVARDRRRDESGELVPNEIIGLAMEYVFDLLDGSRRRYSSQKESLVKTEPVESGDRGPGSTGSFVRDMTPRALGETREPAPGRDPHGWE